MNKNLGKWQIVSLISRFSALFIGLAQSIVLTRILTVSEFGLVSLVGAIGAMAGIAQHLGLASGTTREISATKDERDIFKILVSSVIIKYIVTIPIALFLFFAAGYLATHVYKHPEIILPLQLYSLVLIVQGVQSIFNSVIAGLQKFKALFVYQTAIAVLSLVLYIPLIYFFRVDGYFYALVLFNVIGTLVLAALALWPLRNSLRYPNKTEFGGMFKNIFMLSMAIYFVKVLYTVWYKFGQLSLGYINAIEAVGVFSFGLLYASKLMTISDALTDVNLPVFTKEFSTNLANFKIIFKENFNRLYLLILFAGVSAIFWFKDIISVVGLASKYGGSSIIVAPLILSFAFYSYINLLKSSVYIPAKMMKEMISGYIAMVLGTVFSFAILCMLHYGTFDYKQYLNTMTNVSFMAYSMLAGSVVGFILLSILAKVRIGLLVLDSKALSLSAYLIILMVGHVFLEFQFVRYMFYLMHFSVFFYLLDKLQIFSIKSFIRTRKL